MKLWMPIMLCGIAVAQDNPHQHMTASLQVPLQPLAQHVRQLEEAMTYLGQPFKSADLRRIDEAIANYQASLTAETPPAIIRCPRTPTSRFSSSHSIIVCCELSTRTSAIRRRGRSACGRRWGLGCC